jgi:hypothetical protein
MGSEESLCTTSAHSLIETDASNTIEFDGERFILPSTINFDKQATFLKIESAAKSFCQRTSIDTQLIESISSTIHSSPA